MKKIKLLFFIIFLPCFGYSQHWHQYSDSIISNINKNNFEKANDFSQLADNDLLKTKFVKDTLYANYLYAKGVLYSFDETKNGIDLLVESLNIWNNSKKKNYYKIMKIHYFLAKSYSKIASNTNDASDYLMSFKYYENCYLINKKYHLNKNSNFLNSLYNLILISDITKEYSKLKKFADEYIVDFENELIENIDFKLIIVYRLNNDLIGQQKVLQKFLLKYENEKLNQPELLYRIYFEFVNNYFSQKDKYENFKYPKEIIKYGEKAYDIFYIKQLPKDKYLRFILMSLYLVYEELGDNINSQKYNQLLEKYFPTNSNSHEYEEFSKRIQEKYFSKNEEQSKYDELNKLLKTEDYSNFKIKFDEFEVELKAKNDFKRLSDIYGLALYSFEKNEIFRKEDLLEKLNFIILHQSELTKKEQIYFEATLVEFYSITQINLHEALRICIKNLETEDINLKLYFYRFKSIIEAEIGDSKAFKTAFKALTIATEVYGNDSPRVLQYYIDILALDSTNDDINTTKIASKALKIIYDNKLEETDIAAKVWYYLGGEAKSKGNYTDYLRYTNKSIMILEKNGNDSSLNLLMQCLLNLSDIYVKLKEYELATIYLDSVQKYLVEISFGDNEIESRYYLILGNFNFYQNKYKEAKNNYEKSASKGVNKFQNDARLIICDYLIVKDNIKTIASLEKFCKENKTNLFLEYIYLLKYNQGDFRASQKILTDLLENTIKENNQYFHLLSDYEKERLYVSFSKYFEFLNTYLLNNNSDFIKKYVDFRFYSKSLLFSNSFKTESVNAQMVELNNELKSNQIQINKNIESKIQDTKETENLKYRNREIEKLLALETNPPPLFTQQSLDNQLKTDEAYVEIIRINKQSRNAVIAPEFKNLFTDSIFYGAVIIKKNKAPKFILIDDTNQLEKLYTHNFKSKIQNKQEDIESYYLLFEKIENELKDVKKIYLVTDGVYNSINIESIFNPIRKQYLIDYLEIQTVQNIKSIIDKKEDFKFGSNSKAVLLGNPDFDLTLSTSNTNDILLERGLDSNMLNDIKTSVKISMLNGTQKEIESINTILQNTNCSVELYKADQATEDNLKKVNSPSVLHIATHGFFLKNEDTSKTKQSIAELINDNYKNDSYLKSGLLLAGAQNTLNGIQLQNSNNGILMAEEAKSLDLRNTELVVLSACETGLGDNLVGQGVLGLQRAFMIAGAKSVVMSLWTVSDEKTQKLMTLFYSNWVNKNMSKNEALHQAKIEMKRLYPQPYYWAGFVLIE
jgi:CHAT domain-containing protein